MQAVEMEGAECCLCEVDDSEVIATGRDFEHGTVSETLKMARCRRCGHYFLNPRPTMDALEQIYPAHYMSHDFLRSASRLTQWAKRQVYASRCRALQRYLPDREPLEIFEVGCGEGAFCTSLASNLKGRQLRLSGCELKPELAARCRDAGINAYAGPFEEIEFKADRYDVVLMLHVIEHMRNPVLSLEKAFAMLRTGGLLVVETPNRDSLDAAIFRRHHWFDYQFPRHWHLFSTRQLINRVERAGFETVAVVRQVGPMCWVNSVRNYLLDHPRLRFARPLFSRWNPFALATFTLVDLILKQVRETSRFQLLARKRQP